MDPRVDWLSDSNNPNSYIADISIVWIITESEQVAPDYDPGFNYSNNNEVKIKLQFTLIVSLPLPDNASTVLSKQHQWNENYMLHTLYFNLSGLKYVRGSTPCCTVAAQLNRFLSVMPLSNTQEQYHSAAV